MVPGEQLALSRLLFPSLLLAFALAGCRESAFDPGVDAIEKHLANGLTVILVPDPSVPTISYQTWFRAGSADDPLLMSGSSNMIEHLLFKGTEKNPKSVFFDYLDENGAQVGGHASRDYTVTVENIIPSMLDQVVEYEADRMAGIQITQEKLDFEKAVVLERQRLRSLSPKESLEDALWAHVFQGHPYARPVLGIPSHVAAMSSDDLKSFYGDFFCPKNAAVVVTGNFDGSALFKAIRKHYQTIPTCQRNSRLMYELPVQTAERRVSLEAPDGVERFAVGYRITNAVQDDSFAIDVLHEILFDGENSEVRKDLMTKEGLILELYGSSYTPFYSGLFSVYATVSSGKSPELAEKRLHENLDRIFKAGFTQKQIDFASKSLILQLLKGLRNPSSQAETLGNVWAITGSIHELSKSIERYTKVTLADVDRVAKKYFHPNRRTVVTLTSKKGGRK